MKRTEAEKKASLGLVMVVTVENKSQKLKVHLRSINSLKYGIQFLMDFQFLLAVFLDFLQIFPGN